jgi:hypothetical protein
MSGSIAGTTYAHNRGGPYARRRATPVNPSSTKQQAIRNILATCSAAWAGLTDAQRAAWTDWAALNPVVNSLGQSQQLTGHQAFNQLNTIRGLSALAPNTTPPAGTGPAQLETASATLTNPTTVAITFTPTPLAAGQRLAVWATLPSTAGRNPNRNQARLVGISAAAATSPQSFTTPYPAVVGQVMNIWVCIIDSAGRMSPGILVRQTWA